MLILDQTEIDEGTIQEWRQFIGPDADYYVQAWLRVKNGQFFGFNVYAFVFNIFWLLYRQMFKAVILILSIFFAMSFLEKILIIYLPFQEMPEYWILLKVFFFALALGYSGNWIYLRHTEEAIKKIKSDFSPQDQSRIMILRGGVSYIPVFLFIIILLLSILINLVHPDTGFNFNTFIR